MDILSLALCKSYLRIEEGETLEDEVITFQAESAESAVLDYIEMTIDECYSEFTANQWNSMKMACLLLLEDLYNHRGVRDENGNLQVSGVALMFLKPLSKLA